MGETAVRQNPPELVALKRALGRQLAARREAAETGQQQVARKTGYSRPSVAHAEAGRQLLTRDFWTTADELLGGRGSSARRIRTGARRKAGARAAQPGKGAGAGVR